MVFLPIPSEGFVTKKASRSTRLAVWSVPSSERSAPLSGSVCFTARAVAKT